MLNLDSVVGVLAPNMCIACGVEGHVMCPDCLKTAGNPLPSRCAGCKILTENNETCRSCKRWFPVDWVMVATEYIDIYEELLHAYKFDVRRQAAEPISSLMAEMKLPEGGVLCPLPTAPARIRERGFDHTKLLARIVGKRMRRFVSYNLKRYSSVRQLGASRSQRIKQMQDEFYVESPEHIKGEHIVLLDDVITTGASLASAAHTLKKAGAAKVSAIVYAQKL